MNSDGCRHTDLRIRTMNAVNAVLLLIVVWAFTAVCQADDADLTTDESAAPQSPHNCTPPCPSEEGVISVSCEDVTGTVGEEVTLSCSVSLKCTERCIIKYKFYYTENDTYTEICREEFPDDSCEQRNSFTCRFTPTTAMTRQFIFLVQTQCGRETAGFTVNITETSTPETATEDLAQEDKSIAVTDSGSKNTVIAAVVGCFLILIIFTMTIICKRKSHHQPQWIPVFLSCRHDEDDSHSPVNVI